MDKVVSTLDLGRKAAPPGDTVGAESDLVPRISPREREVLALLGKGQTPKEVAFELKIAHSTVRVLRARALKKMSLGRTGSA